MAINPVPHVRNTFYERVPELCIVIRVDRLG